MSSILPFFWTLSSVKKADRINASIKLISALEQFQADFISEAPASIWQDEEEPEIDEEPSAKLDSSNAQDVSYSLRRLIRGLASPRESSRLGFAVALTELLSRINTVTCAQIVDLIDTISRTDGSATGQEERDVLFARLFGFVAVIQSGLIVKQKPLQSSSNLPSSLRGFEKLLQELLLLGEKKSWLLESSWWALMQAVEKVQTSDVTWKSAALDMVIEQTFTPESVWTPEKVALAITLQGTDPLKEWSKYVLPAFKEPLILSTKNLTTLGRILKEVPDLDENRSNNKLNTGFWKPQLHFVWDLIFDKLLSPEQNATVSFEDFFRVVVDDTLFASTSAPERKYWGFQIIRRALQRLPSSSISFVFTPNFMRSWINHLSQNDRYLNKVAKQVALDVQNLVAKHSDAGISIILQLTGSGTRHFDRVTKTKTVETILSSLDIEQIKTYVDHLLSHLNLDEEEEETKSVADQSIDARRIWVIEQLAVLLKNSRIPQSDDWMSDVLDVLTTFSFFTVTKKSKKSVNRALRIFPKPPLSAELREVCRTKLFSCLTELMGRSTQAKRVDESRSTKAIGLTEEGQFWLSKVVLSIHELEQDRKHVRAEFENDKDAVEFRSRAMELVNNLRKRDTRSDVFKGAELVLEYVILRLYAMHDLNEEIIKSCLDACHTLLADESDKKSKLISKTNEESTENNPSVVDLFVDILIGFLEESSAFTRIVATQAFSMLTSEISDTSINLILTQLETRNVGDDLDDALDDDNKITESFEDDIFSEINGKDSGSESEEDNDVTRAEASEKSFSPGPQQPQNFQKQLEKTDSEEEEEVMDDDQMMRIDDQLTAIFRSKAEEQKLKKSSLQREATHFKIRVLDLLDIFIKKEPKKELVLQTVLPLVQLVTAASADELQLSDKAIGIIRSRLSRPKEVPSLIDFKPVNEMLQSLHAKARKLKSQQSASAISQCSLYLSRVLSESGNKFFISIYKESTVDFASRKASSLPASFIKDFIQRFPAASFEIRLTLVDQIPKAVNTYRQCQLFSFLFTLICQWQFSNDDEKEFINILRTAFQLAHDTIVKSCDQDRQTLGAAQVKDILKYCLQSLRHAKKAFQFAPVEDIKADTWSDLTAILSKSERFKNAISLQVMCRQLSTFIKNWSVAQKVADELPTQLKRKGFDDTVATPRKKRIKRSKG